MAGKLPRSGEPFEEPVTVGVAYILLVATGVMDIEPGLLAASGLAVLNAGVGVLVHQGILWTVRQVRRAMNSSHR